MMLLKPSQLAETLEKVKGQLVQYSKLECRTEADAIRCDHYLELYLSLKTRLDFAAVIKPYEATWRWRP